MTRIITTQILRNEQVKCIQKKFHGYTILNIPARGMTKREIQDVINKTDVFIFITPFPMMMKMAKDKDWYILTWGENKWELI